MPLDLKHIRDLTKTALTQSNSVLTGAAKDEDLRLYESMDRQDFDHLKSQHGEEEVTQYIKEMEAKRLRGRR